jgi:carbon monoxide dehydrogenase subunit G
MASTRRVASRLNVDAPSAAVWAFCADVNRYPEYVEMTDRVFDISEGPLREGYVYHEYGGVPPFKSRSRWTVVEYESPVRQVHVGDDGTMTAELEILLAPAGSGTDLALSIEMRPRWYLALPIALLWPVLRGRTQAGLDQTARNMKRLIEAESNAAVGERPSERADSASVRTA